STCPLELGKANDSVCGGAAQFTVRTSVRNCPGNVAVVNSLIRTVTVAPPPAGTAKEVNRNSCGKFGYVAVSEGAGGARLARAKTGTPLVNPLPFANPVVTSSLLGSPSMTLYSTSTADSSARTTKS